MVLRLSLDAEALVRIEIGELVHSVVKIVACCRHIAIEVVAALLVLLMWLVVLFVVVARQGAHTTTTAWTATCMVRFHDSNTTRCRAGVIAGR